MDDKASKIKKRGGVQEERRTIREKHGEEKLEEFPTKQMKFYKKLKNRLDKYFWHYQLFLKCKPVELGETICQNYLKSGLYQQFQICDEKSCCCDTIHMFNQIDFNCN